MYASLQLMERESVRRFRGKSAFGQTKSAFISYYTPGDAGIMD